MMSLSGTCFLFILIKIVDFKLSPDKVSFFRVVFDSPPKSPLQQTFDQKVIIAFSKIKSIFIVFFQGFRVFQDQWIVNSVSQVDHKDKLSIVTYLNIVNSQVSFISELSDHWLFRFCFDFNFFRICNILKNFLNDFFFLTRRHVSKAEHRILVLRYDFFFDRNRF